MRSPKPYTTGRIVLYTPAPGSIEANAGPEGLPAIIVRVEYPEQLCSMVNLKVFTNGPQDTLRVDVAYSQEKEANTWHWPEIK